MTQGERFVRGEDAIIKKYWGAIPDWRMMMCEFLTKGYDRTLNQIQRRAELLQQKRILPKKKHVDRKGTSVRCVETGEVFKSIALAGRKHSKYSRAAQGISRVAKGQQGKAYGFHWEFCDTSCAETIK